MVDQVVAFRKRSRVEDLRAAGNEQAICEVRGFEVYFQSNTSLKDALHIIQND